MKPILFILFLWFASPLHAVERLVQTGVVTLGGNHVSRNFPAVLSAIQVATLSFTVGGPLIEVRTQAGDSVKKGDVLMRIKPRDFQNEVNSAQARLNAAQAELFLMKAGARSEDIAILQAKLDSAQAQQTFARAEFNRAQPLLKKKAITPSELEQMQSSLRTADAQIRSLEQELLKARTGERKEEIAVKEAEITGLQVNLEIAQSALDDTNLRAPFDGIVAVQNVNNYEIVHPGNPVITIMDISKLKVTIWIPERDILLSRQIKVHGIVTFPNLSQREFYARLKEGEAEANSQTRAWKVVFEMENPPDVMILPGMTAILTIVPDEKEEEKVERKHTLIPVTALCADSRGQFVWLVGPQNHAVRRNVKPGILYNSREIEILEGLNVGEKIVINGAQFVEEGDVLQTEK